MASTTQILITGGTGFAGSHLVEFLLSQNINSQQIHVTSQSDKASFLTPLLPKENIHAIDLTNAKQVNNLFSQYQFAQIYHLASISVVGESFDLASEILQNNLSLQKNLLAAVQKFSPQAKILHIGTAAIYAPSSDKLSETAAIQPDSPYAQSKLEQEKIIAQYPQLKIVIARPFNHIGERQTPSFAIPAFAQQIALIEKGQTQFLQVGNLDGVRDFTDVKDMVRAYFLLMQEGIVGEIYNLGSGREYLLSEVLEKLLALSEQKIELKTDQARLRPSDNPYIVCNNSKISRLGWQAKIPLTESLARILNYWRENT